MERVESLTGDSFVTAFDWGRFSCVIDIGGSRGAKSVAILRHHPAMHAIVVDRAHAVQGAREYWAAREPPSGVDRLQFACSDAREAVPAAASEQDLYLLSALLHGFDDDAGSRILRNVSSAAAPKGGQVVVMEVVVPDRHADPASTSFDLQMLVNTRGRVRTMAEWHRLLPAPACIYRRSCVSPRSGKCWWRVRLRVSLYRRHVGMLFPTATG